MDDRTRSANIRIAIPTQRGILSSHFGRCRDFTFFDVVESNIVGQTTVHRSSHEQGGAPHWINEHGVNVVIAGGMGPRAIDMFRGFGIDVATGAIGSVRSVLEAYLRGEHREVVACAHDHPESCSKREQQGGESHG